MACALFDPVGEHGEDLLASEAVAEPELSVSARGSKTGKPKSGAEKPKGQRAKKSEVVMLSTSFTCWRKVPDSRIDWSLIQIFFSGFSLKA